VPGGSTTSTCSKISLIFPEFFSLLLASYFSKNFASKISAALEMVKPVALTTINILEQWLKNKYVCGKNHGFKVKHATKK